jgi:hypothetical protein
MFVVSGDDSECHQVSEGILDTQNLQEIRKEAFLRGGEASRQYKWVFLLLITRELAFLVL